MTRINIMFNIIYNHRIFHHQIRQHLFHLINQSNQRMLTRTHISCKNINPDVNNIINPVTIYCIILYIYYIYIDFKFINYL